ncbi:hypothetical protein D9Q98_000651 [Chlorella vulgaris]|uniref:Phosphoglycolate phosphatase n=1 Tax=Chlorella vulgaris TaxID=3077 RepID=A0A9D4TYH4_CHLVU|nr:hypothetical protein D9Q98_000651 [Chlorella vulgaris]
MKTAAIRAQEAPGTLPGAQLAVKLTAHDSDAVDELLQSVSTLVLDCDGVLWVGDALVPGTVAALQRFRQLGKRLLFLTNNSSKSRRLYRAKFASLDIAVAPEEIVPTSYTAAAYLQSRNFKKKVYLIGTDGVGEELAAAGIEHVTWQELVGSPTATNGAAEMQREWTAASFGRLQLDQSIGAVVVGWDPNFSYSSMCCAAACLRELPGCEFVATNLDPADNMGNGRMMPGTGCIVRAVETAAGREAVNVGKGGSWLLPFLCEQYDILPSQACIIGDRLDTDIALGRQGGLQTVLPLSGVTKPAQLLEAESAQLPHYVVDNLAALAGISTC